MSQLPPFVEATLMGEIGVRVQGIAESTRLRVADAIADGLNDGLGAAQLGKLIQANAAFDEYRAEMIARTETNRVLNVSQLAAFKHYGVEQVQAIDGDDDDECAARNGRIFSVQEAYGIQDHPNGTLDWAPLTLTQAAEATNQPPPVEPVLKPTRLRGSYAPPGGSTYREMVDEWQVDTATARSIRKGMMSDSPPPLSVTMLDALTNHSRPAPSGTLYRGLSFQGSAEDAQAKFGREFDLGASSFSSSRRIATFFTSAEDSAAGAFARSEQATPVLLKVTGARGFDISRIGDSFEKEWVAMGRFRPIGSRFIDDPDQGRILEIHVEQIASIG